MFRVLGFRVLGYYIVVSQHQRDPKIDPKTLLWGPPKDTPNYKRYRAPASAGGAQSTRIGHAWSSGRGSNGGKPRFRRVCCMPVPAFMEGVGWA